MDIHYLEIVTPDVEGLCQTYEDVFGAVFSEPIPELGMARTADMPEGGRVGIRAPMSPDETPVTRPYFLVKDIRKAAAQAEKTGGEIIHPPLEIAGQGIFAICLTGGIQHGFWQV